VKLAAALVGAACLFAAGAQASPRGMLGIDYEHGRLAWFDPATLTPLPGRKVAMRDAPCSWSLSADRAQLAYSDCNGKIMVVNARAMRRVASMDVAGPRGSVENLVWLRPDRLIATSTSSTLLVIDPRSRRPLRRVDLPGPVNGRALLADGRVAFLTSNAQSFGPARITIADSDGNVRVAVLDRITVGSVFDPGSDDPHGAMRTAGFAVDRAGGRAYVVSPVLLVAEVDLTTLEVTYHGATRTLAKAIDGPSRSAAWLGGGLLAVSGSDYSTTGTGKDRRLVSRPYGLNIVDTRTWTVRLVDPTVEWFQQAAGLLLVERGYGSAAHTFSALTPDGAERYRIALAAKSWVELAGGLGYVCEDTKLVRVVDAATGATVAAPHGRTCVTLLDRAASEW
jgi:hypothetical protein